MTYIDELANAEVARIMAELETARQAEMPTAEQQAAQRLHSAEFRERVTQECLLHSVHPRAIRHVVAAAADVFELKDGALVPKHGQTNPGDPLEPLTPHLWLEELEGDEPYLFTPPTRPN